MKKHERQAFIAVKVTFRTLLWPLRSNWTLIEEKGNYKNGFFYEKVVYLAKKMLKKKMSSRYNNLRAMHLFD